MSFSSVLSSAVLGMDAEIVHVEADLSNGLPGVCMVGYLSSEVKEASQRVMTAICNSGFSLPPKKIVINLSPATVKKRGSSFDLPIAAAILVSLGEIKQAKTEGILFAGELGLNGNVCDVPGILPMALKAKEYGVKVCVVPESNAAEGALVSGISVIGVKSISQLVSWLSGEEEIEPYSAGTQPFKARSDIPDYSDVQGQEAVKRATEVAVSGGHNLLLIGPPGSGKSMIAGRLPGIFPPMTYEESIEVTKIYSVKGLIDRQNPLIRERPFRAVHHTVTKTALIGGGAYPRPGEITLSHCGVLFMDELPEFRRDVIEVLRQPLEERVIHIARAFGSCAFPADFMLVAAMNPCPCGNYPDPDKCTCTPRQIKNYLSKLSHPFLDRIDICVEAPKVEYEALKGRDKAESSAQIRQRVCRTRQIQAERFEGTGIRSNAGMGVNEVKKYCALGEKEERLMELIYKNLGVTARTYYKILKVARTIADMEGAQRINESHIREAAGYRTMDKP